LRVLRPNPDGTFTAIGSSLPQSLYQRTSAGGDASYVFNARIAVQKGDQIALDRDRRAGGVYRAAPAGRTSAWIPPLLDNDTAAPGPGSGGVELMVNATLEPDADADGWGDETQDNCPTVANDQTSNPCPASERPDTSGPAGGSDEPTPAWRRHRAKGRVHGRAQRGRRADQFGRHKPRRRSR
jgi:hypothetical protein